MIPGFDEVVTDDLHPSADPLELRVNDFDVRNAVFVVPIDAPIPSELGEGAMPTGSLYKRLAALDAPLEDGFAFVPVSGSELLSLDRAWRSLQSVKRVFLLMDLPGARYDVLFGQAARQIGIPKVEWPSVAEAMSSRVRVMQRATDSTPWQMKSVQKDSELPAPGPRRSRLPQVDGAASDRVAPPPPEDEA